MCCTLMVPKIASQTFYASLTMSQSWSRYSGIKKRIALDLLSTPRLMKCLLGPMGEEFFVGRIALSRAQSE